MNRHEKVMKIFRDTEYMIMENSKEHGNQVVISLETIEDMHDVFEWLSAITGQTEVGEGHKETIVLDYAQWE